MQRIDNPPSNLFEDGNEYTGKVGTTVTAAWLTALQEETSNFIEETGLTLDELDNGQMWEAALRRFDWWRLETATITFVNATSFKVDGDVTGIYVQHRAVKLTQTSDDKGYVASSSFSAGETTVNVTDCTVDSGLSAVEYGQELLSEPFNPNVNEVKRGYQDGMILSNDAVDASHDISISPGIARDGADTFSIISAAAIIKQIDANWAAGSNAGGFPSGLTLTADTWYAVWVIAKPDGTVDGGYDISMTAANLLADAAGFTKYRYRGSVLTDGSSNIIAFVQNGDIFEWLDPPLDINGVASGTTMNTWTISTPTGLKTKARIHVSAVTTFRVYIKNPQINDEVPAANAAPLLTFGWEAAVSGVHMGVHTEVLTNNSSQINLRGVLNKNMYIATIGWTDFRGKDG